MNCHEAQLSEAALGAPDAALADHLARCRACSEDLLALRKTVARVRSAGPGVPAARPHRSALLAATVAAALVVVLAHREPVIEPGTTLDPRVVTPDAKELLAEASVPDLARVSETEERALLAGPAPAEEDPALDNFTTIASLEDKDLDRALDKLPR